MKYISTLFALAVATCTFLIAVNSAPAQGTAFTYQDRLNDGASPATGIYDLRFTIYDALASGSQIGGTVTSTATAVSNGLFTVTVDFGAGVFNGADRWLEIGVRANGGGAFTTLIPRQQLTPALSLGVRGKETPDLERGSGTFHASPGSGSGSGVLSLLGLWG